MLPIRCSQKWCELSYLPLQDGFQFWWNFSTGRIEHFVIRASLLRGTRAAKRTSLLWLPRKGLARITRRLGFPCQEVHNALEAFV